MNKHEPIIDPTARIGPDVEIGDFSVIGEHVIIKGDVKIGREAWIAPHVVIGGGRSEMGSLKTGNFLHLGLRSFVNIADRVEIGDEVGIGVESKIYTHGAYLSEYNGFPYSVGPITIGNNVWVPNAMILPKVKIGNNVVIGAMSLVNKNIPSDCLAAGIPAKVLKRNQYPKRLTFRESKAISKQIWHEAKIRGVSTAQSSSIIIVNKTRFMPLARKIEGPANKDTEIVKDLFRRHGIRFKYYNDGEKYREWD